MFPRCVKAERQLVAKKRRKEQAERLKRKREEEQKPEKGAPTSTSITTTAARRPNAPRTYNLRSGSDPNHPQEPVIRFACFRCKMCGNRNSRPLAIGAPPPFPQLCDPCEVITMQIAACEESMASASFPTMKVQC